jgi:hypothetical protein
LTFSGAAELSLEKRHSFHWRNEFFGVDSETLRANTSEDNTGERVSLDLHDVALPRLTNLTKLTLESGPFIDILLQKHEGFFSAISARLESLSVVACGYIEDNPNLPRITELLDSCSKLKKLKFENIDYTLAKKWVAPHTFLECLDLEMQNFPWDDAQCSKECREIVEFVASTFPKLKRLRLGGQGRVGAL